MGASRVWVLLYSRTGDNNQALALAGALGLPFEEKKLLYNRLREVGPHLGPSLITLKPQSRRLLSAPWPEVVIAIGRWSVPVARWIKARSLGRTKIIFLGNPRVDPNHFDLVFATADYLGPRGSNVAMASLPVAAMPDSARTSHSSWIDGFPAPRILLLVGGPVKYWQLSCEQLQAALRQLAHKTAANGGSLIVSGSPRTPPSVLAMLRRELYAIPNSRLAPSNARGLGELLAAADEIIVTGDSMAMATEAILTGKPVGILPLELSDFGWRKLGLEPALSEIDSNRRDLRRYWFELWERGLAGTVSEPRAAEVESPAVSAARVAARFLGLDVADRLRLPPAAFTVVGNPGKRRQEIGPPSVPPKRIAPLGAPASRFARVLEWVRTRAHRTGRDAGALALAARDPRIPWYVKLPAWIASLTAVSPIDLTPDFIPLVGYLDDLVLMVIGTLVAVRLIPAPLWAELRARAATSERVVATGAIAVSMVWLFAGTAAAARVF